MYSISANAGKPFSSAKQLAQAEENLKRVKEEVAVAIERSYNKMERTRSLVQVASQVLRRKRMRITGRNDFG
jgi:hypothetical protein